MHDDPEKVTYFGITDARNRRIPFGIKAKDRTRHLYVIGKTGMGKSNLLEVLAIQDIRDGNGVCFIDPHGKTADLLMEHVPEERINDVLYFAPFDTEFPISFNVLEDVGIDKRHLVVSGLMSSFKKIWQDAWSARMEYILTNTLLALLEYPDSTLLLVNKMLSDKKFRQKVVDNISDVSVKSFWVDEFANYTDRMAAEATPAIQNKVGQFTSNPLIRNILGQSKSTFDLRQLMDEKKIVIVNLSKGRIGEANAQLLGSMLVTKIYLAAMSRADVHESTLETLPPFYLYVDEFQSFANESFADILAEARKYKLSLNIAHQYIEQMPEEVRSAVFGNVGTMITFRVGATDAEYLEKEFAPTFSAQDIVNLGKYQMYLRLMIDGVGSQPFSAMGLPPLERDHDNFFDNIIAASRRNFANPRAEVDERVRQSLGIGEEKQQSEQKNTHSTQQQQQPKKKNNKKKSSEPKKSDTKPMIDEQTKKQLEAMLHTPEGDSDDAGDVADESQALQKAVAQKKVKNKKPDPKKVSDEHRNGLKDALAAALGAQATQQPAAKEHEEKKEVSPEKKTTASGPQEVSEDDLRAILDA